MVTPVGPLVPSGPVDKADTAWMLVATALVLLMTPALGFFYGGLVRSKNALNTMMMSFVVARLRRRRLGARRLLARLRAGLRPGSAASRGAAGGVGLEAQGTIPHLLFMAYQGTFAIITAALISGAIVERMRFGPYLAFLTLWGLVVYAPVAHWVWGGGWLAKLGALDFAGGTVVHVNAGAAALVAALVLGPRKDYARQAILPHNVPFTLLGAGLLWFGWFGFNAGSALAANGSAALAFVNTMLAPTAHARRLDAPRPRAHAAGRRPSAPPRRSSSASSRSRRPPASSARSRRSCSAAWPRSRATSRCSGARARASTTRSTWWPRTASAARSGALLTGVLAQKAWNGTAGRPALRQPAAARRSRPSACWRRSPTAAPRTFGLLKLIGAVAPLRAGGARGGPGPRRDAARRGGLRARRGRDPRAARVRRRPAARRAPRPRPPREAPA